MDRFARVAAIATAAVAPWLLAAATACAPARSPAAYAPLPPGQARASRPAAALGRGPVLARGVLGYAVAFGPGGGTVAVELGGAFELVVRDSTGAEQRRVALGEAGYDVTGLALSPGAERALVASVDGTVSEVDLHKGAVTRRFRLGRRATAAAFVGDDLIATGDDLGVVCLRRADDGALLQCAVAHGTRVGGLAAVAGPAGEWRIASCSWAGDVALWSAPSLRALGRRSLPGAATNLAFSPSGQHLAAAYSPTAPVRSPSVVARERAVGYPAPDPGARAVVFDLREGDHLSQASECLGHAGPVTSVAWTSDGRRLLTGSWDRTIRLWSVGPECAEAARIGDVSGLVAGVSASPTGRFAAAATWIEALDEPAIILFELLYPKGAEALPGPATPLQYRSR